MMKKMRNFWNAWWAQLVKLAEIEARMNIVRYC